MIKNVGVVLLGLAFAVMNAYSQNTFPSTGNAGIGTTVPGTPLQVVGTGNVVSVGEASYSSGHQLLLGVNNSGNGYSTIQSLYEGTAYTPLILNANGGNVGIGTTTPGNSLDVNGGIQTSQLNSGYVAMTLGDKLATTGSKGWLIRAEADASPWQGLADSLDFEYWNGTNDITPVTLSASGSVGIGTTSPGSKLEVNGNLKLTSGSGASITFADGTVQSTAYTGVTCGGDYADSVDVSGERRHYEPGDVLALTSDGNGDVVKSNGPYSTLVAGIYSTRPGTVGRRQTTDPKSATKEIPMAMVGIVPTKVSAENGPIRRGDLLVTARLEGYAMRGTDRRRMLGAVVGKAMGSLDSGKGVIEVLVTLQ